ncbi:MAG: MBOAT family protein [Ruminococcus sp.]|nr:MBOAT family protein [Ruminococcus sp.]
MVFSSLEFIFIFLPIFMAVYAFTPFKYKNAVIFCGSVIFYSMGVLSNPIYILLFLVTVLVNFIVGQMISTFRKAGKAWLTFGIAYNFIWLIFFKYTNFIFSNINGIFRSDIPMRNIVLPIGISFYTFQNVSYIIDVYRKKAKPEKNLINYGAYISMFPQLIAGPIVTYQTVAEQLKFRKHTPQKIENGLKTFTIGLGYKVLIANRIGALWSDIDAIGYSGISTKLAWLGVVAYSFQLFFDFNGYSLMAKGLGEVMGFDIPKNFDYPYTSVTMTEFWRRWHMTLGSWFRDYVYIPLGGNRKGQNMMIRNTVIVWLFTGLWHGASWNFVLWGLVLCGLILLEKFYIGKVMNEYKLLGHIYMFLVIPLTWTLFAITDFHSLGIYFQKLFHLGEIGKKVIFDGDFAKYWGIYRKFFIIAAICSTKLPERVYKKIKNTPFCAVLLLAVFWLSVYCMYKGMNDPFMYFRF